MTNPISRRNLSRLLGSAAAAAAVSPFVPASTYAAGPTSPRRLLVVYHGLGYLEESFWPTPGPSGEAEDFELGATQAVLEPYRDRLVYPDGLLLYGAQWFFPDDDNEHGSGGAMTFTASRKQGYATGPSFEQLAADHLFAEASTPFRDLALGVGARADEHTACFFRGPGQPVVPQNNPAAAFRSLFANLATGDTDEAALARMRSQKQSVLDFVRGELTTVRGRIGGQEAKVLDQHLDHVAALERRLLDLGTACAVPNEPASGGGTQALIEAQMDLVAGAFACDLTRVATLQLGHCDGGLDILEGVNAHDTTHAVGETQGAAGVLETHRALDAWWADRWLYLLQALDAIPDGDGTLLDNTLIVWGTDTTTGQSLKLGPHQHWRMPYFMAGGGNWAFPTGRHLRLDRPGSSGEDALPGWASNSRLFVSILQRLGLELDTFGNMDIGTGTLPGL